MVKFDKSSILDNIPCYYTYNKAIFDKLGEKIEDYEIIEISEKFKKNLISGDELLRKGIKKDLNSWLNENINIIKNGGDKDLEKYQKIGEFLFKVDIYSKGDNYFTAFYTDITEIITKDSLLKTITESMFDIVSLSDLNGKFIYIGNSHKRLGYSSKDLLGRDVFENVHPDDISIIKNNFNHFLKTSQSKKAEYRYKTKWDEYVWLETQGSFIFNKNGDPETIMFTSRDVTDRKKNEIALKESEERFRTITESIVGVVYLTDLEGNIRYLSQNSIDIFNYKPKEMIGTKFINYLAPESVDSALSEFRTTILTGRRQINLELRMKKKGGKLFFGELSGSTYLKEGKVVGTIGVIRDLTRLKLALKESKAANIAKSQFLSNISHEIRSPLNGIIGFTDLLSTTELSKNQQFFTDNIINSAKYLLNIINDILDFSTFEGKNLELQYQKTDIDQFLETLLNLVLKKGEKKGLKMGLNYPKGVLKYIEIDPYRLRQAIFNLLNNAVKFTKKGTIELNLDIKILDDKKAKLKFSIDDTGVGISEEERDSIFKIFSQADNSIRKCFGGVGLGLMISNSLIKNMGGVIEFKSEKGVGSSFFFNIDVRYWPVSEPNKSPTRKK